MSADFRANNGVGREHLSISNNLSQSIANSTPTKVTFTAFEFQLGSINPSSSEIVIVVPGVYEVSAGLFWDTTAATQRRQMFAETYTGADPGVASATRIGTTEVSATGFLGLSLSRGFLLAAGAKVRVGAFQTTGGALLVRGDLSPSYLSLVKVA